MSDSSVRVILNTILRDHGVVKKASRVSPLLSEAMLSPCVGRSFLLRDAFALVVGFLHVLGFTGFVNTATGVGEPVDHLLEPAAFAHKLACLDIGFGDLCEENFLLVLFIAATIISDIKEAVF